MKPLPNYLIKLILSTSAFVAVGIALAMLTGGVATSLKRAFLQVAAFAFEEKFGTFPAAKAAVGTRMPTHLLLSSKLGGA